MKEIIVNTSWSCTPKVFQKRVGCDVLAYVINAETVNVQFMRPVMRVIGEIRWYRDLFALIFSNKDKGFYI